MENIREQAACAVTELLEAAKLMPGELLVVGCSSSEIVGQRIGRGSSLEAAEAVYDGIAPILSGHGTAERYGWEPVNVRPWAHAGGSFATTVWEHMAQPVALEHIRAHAGLDIGDTLIGMHLREVAVPVRLSIKKIGEANLVCARTRPKFIGGERARYVEEQK